MGPPHDTVSCPHCGTSVAVAAEQRPTSFPFCSARCRLIDLGAWADGDYVVPGRSLAVDVESSIADEFDQLRRRAATFRGDDQ